MPTFPYLLPQVHRYTKFIVTQSSSLHKFIVTQVHRYTSITRANLPSPEVKKNCFSFAEPRSHRKHIIATNTCALRTSNMPSESDLKPSPSLAQPVQQYTASGRVEAQLTQGDDSYEYSPLPAGYIKFLILDHGADSDPVIISIA